MGDLQTLRPQEGSKKNRKRVGRGPGSGHGKTSCRGHKGQRSRSGGKGSHGFEGGQMPLQRRIPKRGFRSRLRVVYQLVNIRELEKWDREAPLDPEAMAEAGLIRKAEERVKVLGDGELTHPVRVRAHKFSRQASEKIKLAGGVAEVIEDA